jgi:hypothetical protein
MLAHMHAFRALRKPAIFAGQDRRSGDVRTTAALPLAVSKGLVKNQYKEPERCPGSRSGKHQSGGGAVALSQDEQRMLDEMERNLAADDPRLAARLNSFGRARVPGQARLRHARTAGGILALALIAAVTVMVFMISPFANHLRNDEHPRSTPPSAAARSNPSSRTSATATGTGDATGAKTAKAPAAHSGKAPGAKGTGTPAGAKH